MYGIDELRSRVAALKTEIARIQKSRILSQKKKTEKVTPLMYQLMELEKDLVRVELAQAEPKAPPREPHKFTNEALQELSDVFKQRHDAIERWINQPLASPPPATVPPQREKSKLKPHERLALARKRRMAEGREKDRERGRER
jgi:hypothetical protein